MCPDIPQVCLDVCWVCPASVFPSHLEITGVHGVCSVLDSLDVYVFVVLLELVLTKRFKDVRRLCENRQRGTDRRDGVYVEQEAVYDESNETPIIQHLHR